MAQRTRLCRCRLERAFSWRSKAARVVAFAAEIIFYHASTGARQSPGLATYLRVAGGSWQLTPASNCFTTGVWHPSKLRGQPPLSCCWQRLLGRTRQQARAPHVTNPGYALLQTGQCCKQWQPQSVVSLGRLQSSDETASSRGTLIILIWVFAAIDTADTLADDAGETLLARRGGPA